MCMCVCVCLCVCVCTLNKPLTPTISRLVTACWPEGIRGAGKIKTEMAMMMIRLCWQEANNFDNDGDRDDGGGGGKDRSDGGGGMMVLNVNVVVGYIFLFQFLLLQKKKKQSWLFAGLCSLIRSFQLHPVCKHLNWALGPLKGSLCGWLTRVNCGETLALDWGRGAEL